MAAQHPASLVSVRPNGLEDTAQFKLEVDQEKAQALGVSLSDINQTISTALGGTYVNDFIDRGRVKKVYVQADAKFRMLPEDVDKLYVRSANGEMVPFSAFTTAHWCMALRDWSATTVCRQWRFRGKPRQEPVPAMPWR